MADTESARANTAFQDFIEAEQPLATPDEQKALWVGWWACWKARDPGGAGRVLGEIRDLLGIGFGVSVIEAIKAMQPEPEFPIAEADGDEPMAYRHDNDHGFSSPDEIDLQPGDLEQARIAELEAEAVPQAALAPTCVLDDADWADSCGFCVLCGGMIGDDKHGCDVPAGARCLAATRRQQLAMFGETYVLAVEAVGRFLA